MPNNLYRTNYEVRDIEFEPRGLAESPQQAASQLNNLLLDFYNPPKPEISSRSNRPDIIRKKFIKYLQSDFPHFGTFKHPVSKQTFSYNLVREKIHAFKELHRISGNPVPKAGARDYSEEVTSQEVRKDFLSYLRNGFPKELGWEHPSTGEILSADVFKEVIYEYRDLFDGMTRLNHRAIWCLFTTQGTRSFIAKHFSFDNSVQKLWRDASDTLMLMALCKELDPHWDGVENYDVKYVALWCRMTTRSSLSFVAEYFDFSDSSIKRLWNDALDTILLMMLYPDLKPEIAVAMYANRG